MADDTLDSTFDFLRSLHRGEIRYLSGYTLRMNKAGCIYEEGRVVEDNGTTTIVWKRADLTVNSLIQILTKGN